MYFSMIQEATFNFVSSPTGLAWSENFGTKRRARGRCRTFIVFGHLCSLAYESQGWRKPFHEEDLLGRMLESFACSAFVHPQLFLGSTVANLGQMALARCRGSIWSEKSLTFRWHGLPWCPVVRSYSACCSHPNARAVEKGMFLSAHAASWQAGLCCGVLAPYSDTLSRCTVFRAWCVILVQPCWNSPFAEEEGCLVFPSWPNLSCGLPLRYSPNMAQDNRSKTPRCRASCLRNAVGHVDQPKPSRLRLIKLSMFDIHRSWAASV